MDKLSGVINIYKEKGYTSHDVVAIVRRLLGRVKAGHTGTLDPAACGVLPVCVGRATKIADYIMLESKGYRAVVKLGITTDTEDDTGNVTAVCEVNCCRAEIESAVASFKGICFQTPPMYSAIKIGGERLYKLARRGEVAERAERRVEIEEIKILEFLDDTSFRIDVRCSKGTYIRTLCADIGRILGCGACMGELQRYANGDFMLEGSITLTQLECAVKENSLRQFIMPVEAVLHRYKRVTVLKRYDKELYNGNVILLSYLAEQVSFSEGERVLVFDGDGEIVGIYTGVFDEEKCFLKSKAMLFEHAKKCAVSFPSASINPRDSTGIFTRGYDMIHITDECIERQIVIVLGNFDGIHIGHRKLILAAKEYAAVHRLATAVFSFSPHPVSVLGDSGFRSILTSGEKEFLLADIGVDYFIEYPFDLNFAAMSPYDFIKNILMAKYNCHAIFVGASFRFGKAQSGDSSLLKEIAGDAGIYTSIINDLITNDSTEKVSSTVIRDLIRSNDFKRAGLLLGYSFFLMGEVAHGKKIGRKIGFPTVNLPVPKTKLLPGNGVYVTRIHLDGDVLPGVTNIGIKPTVSDKPELIAETYIFDFDDDIYGKKIRIEFLEWIRDEIAFGGIDELKRRIEIDVITAREWFKKGI